MDSMIKYLLEDYIREKKTTFLGVGPMSVNCIDSSIELSKEYNIPMMLIASRRQIDSDEMGGGYVNNWSTENFCQYIKENTKSGKIILARDHGGPWQNNFEQSSNMTLEEAMLSAKKSFEVDIDSGFSVLHIDPSIDIHNNTNTDEIIDRACELYGHSWEYAKSKNKDIIFEIGTEEQSGSTNTAEELDYTLSKMLTFCEKNKMSKPFFVVIQTGTKVMELRNVGSLESSIRIENELPPEIQIPMMIDICKKYGVYLKQHNTDYLSSETLKWHPKLGIHAANVAPEYGVTETLAFLEILETNKLHSLSEQFLNLSLNSKKWDKWMIDDTVASDRERSIIAGHYVFSTEQFKSIKKEASEVLLQKDINIDDFMKNRIKQSIVRYLKNFRLLK